MWQIKTTIKTQDSTSSQMSYVDKKARVTIELEEEKVIIDLLYGRIRHIERLDRRK